VNRHQRRLAILALSGLVIAWVFIILIAQAGSAAECDREPNGHAIVVNLDNEKAKETIQHARDAVAAGSPRYLHWSPDGADARRKASLRGHPKVPGRDLDEYPPAASLEGGRGADIRAISRSDNRSAGSRMGTQMRPYCDGQAFILEP
jgi:hypothetical protein